MPNIMDELEKKDIGVGGEIQLTDAIGKTINTSKCCAYRFEGERFDCGSVRGYIQATNHFAKTVFNYWKSLPEPKKST